MVIFESLRLRANGRNIVDQQLPTLLDVTCCIRLHAVLRMPLLHLCVFQRSWSGTHIQQSANRAFLGVLTAEDEPGKNQLKYKKSKQLKDLEVCLKWKVLLAHSGKFTGTPLKYLRNNSNKTGRRQPVHVSWFTSVAVGLNSGQSRTNPASGQSQCCVLIGWAITRLYVIAHYQRKAPALKTKTMAAESCFAS